MSEFRINVIGASGSGTSTLGHSLASALHVPFFESDDYFHAPTDPPYQRQRSAAERCDMIQRDLSPRHSWVLSGGIAGWEPYPNLNFSCVVFLYVPTAVRIARLRFRERQRFGSRIDAGGDMHQTHEEFIDWAAHYDDGHIEGKTLARHEAYLMKQCCPVLEFREMEPVAELTRRVLRSIGAIPNAEGAAGDHWPPRTRDVQ